MSSDNSSDSEAWVETYSDSPQAGKKKKFSTAPPSLLTGRSFLEQQCHWLDHPDFIIDAFKLDDPVERLHQIVKWYFSALAGLHQMEGADKVRKPYNPVLGEQLHVKILDGDDRRIEMVCEQISHHPPLTAFHFENLDPGFSLSGTVGNRAKFRGTYMRIKTDGSATLQLRGNLNETYIMTYPSVDVKGILTGRTSAVLVGSCSIQCPTTHLTARIKFSDKGAVKIKVGHVLRMASKDEPEDGEEIFTELGQITGVWNKELVAKDGNKKKDGAVIWTNRAVGTEARKFFKPANMLDAMDTWKVWEMVTIHLAMGMFDKAGQFKTELEERERTKAKARATAGKPFAPVLFKPHSAELVNLDRIREQCAEPVWEGATVEISLPMVTREPINPDM